MTNVFFLAECFKDEPEVLVWAITVKDNRITSLLTATTTREELDKVYEQAKERAKSWVDSGAETRFISKQIRRWLINLDGYEPFITSEKTMQRLLHNLAIYPDAVLVIYNASQGKVEGHD